MDASVFLDVRNDLKSRHEKRLCRDGITRNSLRKLTKEEFESRFWARVNILDKDSCWMWTASISGSVSKYGHCFHHGSLKKAHRMAWELANKKEIPKGMVACHKCDNRLCCNPDHLFIATQYENMQDCRRKGRFRSGILRGQESGKSKWTEDQVKMALKLNSEGLTDNQISKATGISKTSVGSIVQGRCWNHISGLPKPFIKSRRKPIPPPSPIYV